MKTTNYKFAYLIFSALLFLFIGIIVANRLDLKNNTLPLLVLLATQINFIVSIIVNAKK